MPRFWIEVPATGYAIMRNGLSNVTAINLSDHYETDYVTLQVVNSRQKLTNGMIVVHRRELADLCRRFLVHEFGRLTCRVVVQGGVATVEAPSGWQVEVEVVDLDAEKAGDLS
jgi:hypothetical protein